MNCLIFFPHELIESGSGVTAALRDQRARHAIELHRVEQGLRLRAAIWGGKLGFAQVVKLTQNEIFFNLECQQTAAKRLAIHLVVAVPRPHLVRKTLQFAAMSGVERVSLVRTDKVVPSYLQSKSLRLQEIEAQLLNGLEQAGDSIAPTVEIVSSTELFWRELIGSELKNSRIRWGDTYSRECSQLSLESGALTLCFGPEAGWSDGERKKFLDLGLEPFSLGARMLRLDVALATAVGAAAF